MKMLTKLKYLYSWTQSCCRSIFLVVNLFPIWVQVALITVPIVNSLFNIYTNNLLASKLETTQDKIYYLVVKAIYDYFSWVILSSLTHKRVRKLGNTLNLRLNMSKIKCGVPIPGPDQKRYKDMEEDNFKLLDFIYVIPMLWSTLATFIISIYNISDVNGYPVRLFFALFCVSMVCLMTYLTDPTVYEKTKPNATSITKFTDSCMVRTKLSMGCKLDPEFEEKKRNKIEAQQNIQKYLICVINFLIAGISVWSDNNAQSHTFSAITWMLGCLADNIKSLQYKDFVKEFITLFTAFETHGYKTTKEIPVGRIDSVMFENASFGYYKDTLIGDSEYDQKIHNLTYEFFAGNLYYLEAPNGIGKSTMLRMFNSTLRSGKVYYGCTDRDNINFDDIAKSVFHVVQASEYTPKFSRAEVEAFQGRDPWLEKQLGLGTLFTKDSVEMSGGQKKRVLIYMTLTSGCPILLLDEILSELSTEETPDVPEGGGWLGRVIQTLVNWQGRQSKIVVLVGHGLLDLIPAHTSIKKLKIDTQDGKTVLFER